LLRDPDPDAPRHCYGRGRAARAMVTFFVVVAKRDPSPYATHHAIFRQARPSYWCSSPPRATAATASRFALIGRRNAFDSYFRNGIQPSEKQTRTTLCCWPTWSTVKVYSTIDEKGRDGRFKIGGRHATEQLRLFFPSSVVCDDGHARTARKASLSSRLERRVVPGTHTHTHTRARAHNMHLYMDLELSSEPPLAQRERRTGGARGAAP
jgi:hypothetical protein